MGTVTIYTSQCVNVAFFTAQFSRRSFNLSQWNTEIISIMFWYHQIVFGYTRKYVLKTKLVKQKLLG